MPQINICKINREERKRGRSRALPTQSQRKKNMSATLTPLPVAHTDRRDALVTRLFENLATYDLATIYLGDRLGLYTALHESGPMTLHSSPHIRGRTSATSASGSNNRQSAGFWT